MKYNIEKLQKGGGLSREKDFKSYKKPYPSVAKGDFAGGNRSYPIPTKADAIDALRLAGLHNRPDVRAKVFAKYPELKKQDGGKVTYQEGGNFETWYANISKKLGLNPNPDDSNQQYDYRGFYKKFGNVQMNKGEHFTDEFKLPGHPTFSIESKYSNPKTLGGNWNQMNDSSWVFEHSPYTFKHYKETGKYLQGSGENQALPEIKVYPKKKLQKGGNIDLYNRLNPREAFGLGSFINNGILYTFGGGKPRKGTNLATPEEEAYWKLYNKVPQDLVKPTNVRINADKGDTKSEFVGMPESMKERIAAMADTLNLGKLVRNPESFRTRFPNGPINYLGLKRNYEFAKKVMDNPGKGQQAKEIYSIKESPIKNTGLGALEDFGLVWDKDKKVLKAYDTYDFPSILNLVIPKRDKDLKIREEIPFNPSIGSNLLKDNFKYFNIVK